MAICVSLIKIPSIHARRNRASPFDIFHSLARSLTRTLASPAARLVVPLRPIATCSGCLRRLAISPRGAAIVESPFENNTRPVDVMLSWPPWRANVASTSCVLHGAENSARPRALTLTHTPAYYSSTCVHIARARSCVPSIASPPISTGERVCERTNTYTDYFYLPDDWSLGRLSLRSAQGRRKTTCHHTSVWIQNQKYQAARPGYSNIVCYTFCTKWHKSFFK